MTVTVRGDTISALGFAFDSLAADLSYLEPNGSVSVRVRQDGVRDYARQRRVHAGRRAQRAAARRAAAAVRHDELALDARVEGSMGQTWRRGRRPRARRAVRAGASIANGLLPTEGRADFDLQVRGFAVENVAELLQSDLPVTGLVSLDAHVEGTSTDPQIRGRLDFTRGTYNDMRMPEVHGTFDYANQQLTTNATAVDSTGLRLAVVDGTLPINLALSGVTGPRLLDAPMDVKIVSDSLPLALIPSFTEKVSEAGGLASANFTIQRHAREARPFAARSRWTGPVSASPRRVRC